jgi:transposase
MEAQAAFEAGIPALNSDSLVFIDEAGYSTALNFSTAWSKVGEPAVVIAPMRSPNLTVMGAIANRGAMAFKRLEGALDGATFIRWLREDLGPHLRPGDRVVMDNLRAHKVEGVVEALAEVGASPLYLPPYSPEFNPIELVWAWSKRKVRAIAPRVRKALEAILDGLGATVPTDLCQRWIAHCGYAVGST